MPLHMNGVVSRQKLERPEKPPVSPESVLKFNPNHGPDGRFASSGGGRRGGTRGAPTEDALGNPLKRPGYGTTQRTIDARFDRTPTGPGGGIVPARMPQFQIENPQGKGFEFTPEQKNRNYRAMFGKSPESKPPRPPRTVSGEFHPHAVALNQYILAQEHQARPGETLNQYVERRNASLKIRHSRGL